MSSGKDIRLAKLVIGPNSSKLKEAAMKAYLAGDKEKAVNLLTDAKVRDKAFDRALRLLRN